MARFDRQGSPGADRLTRPPPLRTRVLRDFDSIPPTPKGGVGIGIGNRFRGNRRIGSESENHRLARVCARRECHALSQMALAEEYVEPLRRS